MNLGLLAEIAFDVEAVRHGLHISRPVSDKSVYDRIVDSGTKLFKVQIKGTSYLQRNNYSVCNYKRNKTPYKKNEVDIIAIYIGPENRWFLVPLEEAGTRIIFNSKTQQRLGKYENNWGIFK